MRLRSKIAALALATALLSAPVAGQTAVATEILSGRSIRMEIEAGIRETVVLGCVLLDEKEKWGQAEEYLRKVLLGRSVVLKKGTNLPDRDRYGRLLRYVYSAQGALLNEELEKAGLGYRFLKDCQLRHRNREGSPSQSKPSVGCPRSVRVVGVVDGDTIKVASGDQVETVRVACVDTPESVHPQKPVEYFGREAAAFTTNLTLGRSVCLTTDASQADRDRYGRLLRYVRLPDGRDLGAAIVGSGHGLAYRSSACDSSVDYQQLERSARSTFQGLWNPTNYERDARQAWARSRGKTTDLGLTPGSSNTAQRGTFASPGLSLPAPGADKGDVYVRSYTRRDGTRVRAHRRSRPGKKPD